MATECLDCHETFERKKKGFAPTRCPPCLKEHLKAQKRANPDVWRRYQYKHQFGITVEQYDTMLAAQDGHCAICPATQCSGGRRLAVDHDHETGQVRQLLCDHCNRTLGLMKDDPALLRKAANYLEQHRSLRCA